MLKHKIIWIPGLLCTESLFNHQINSLKDIAEHEVFVIKTYDDIKKASSYVLESTHFTDFTLIGFSMGGYIALEILKQNPERVKSLCLIDTSHKVDSDQRKNIRLASIKQALEGKFTGVGSSLFASMVYNQEDKSHYNLVTEMAEEIGKDSFINQQKLILSRTDSEQTLKNFNKNALFIAGQHDKLTPPSLHYEMKDLSKQGNIGIIEESGHLSPIEQPQAVSALIRYFLENQSV